MFACTIPLVTACVAQASPSPGLAAAIPTASPTSAPETRGPVVAPPTPRTTPAPDIDLGCAELIAAKPGSYPEPTLAPVPAPAIAADDPGPRAAIVRAAEQLATLESYQFTVDIVGRELNSLGPSTVDFGLRGTTSRTNGFAMDTVLGSRMREPDGSAAISASGRMVVGGGYVWATDNISGVLEPTSAPEVIDGLSVLTPEGLAGRVVVPFAAGYRRVGAEKHDGLLTDHYRRSGGGARAYAAALRFDGDISADLWIAADGGYLAAARVSGRGQHRDAATGVEIDDGFLIGFEITKANDAGNVVELPAMPRPDPVRPVHAPVDLRLEYQVLPSDGVRPTAADLTAIGVAIRVRLDISRRPVKVDTLEPDRVGVTICATTDADADRRLIVAHGGLTVVPLPPGTYGTAAGPGATALPAVGAPIDPALPPVAPASRAGLTTAHVDPVSGRRGLAIHLANQATDAFIAFAATHPGEYVALVLDGLVLATLPIVGQTANGNFVFTGDYTEAESRLMASYLYQDPIRFDLQPTADVEVPSR